MLRFLSMLLLPISSQLTLGLESISTNVTLILWYRSVSRIRSILGSLYRCRKEMSMKSRLIITNGLLKSQSFPVKNEAAGPFRF